MANRPETYIEIRTKIATALASKNQEKLVDLLTEMQSEIERIGRHIGVVSAALRAINVELPQPGVFQSTTAMPRNVDIDMRDAIEPVDGFYALEFDSQGPYRWTGPGHVARLRVWIDRSTPMLFHASIASLGHQENRDAVELLVDGVPIPLNVSDTAILSAPFPCHDKAQSTELVLNVPHLFIPEEPGPGSPRTLGISIRKIRISAA